jgi:hypothetical protein
MTKRKRSKLTPCEEKALVTLQAQQIKEKEARAKKRAKKAKEKEGRTVLGGQALPSYSGIQAPIEIPAYTREQIQEGPTQLQYDLRSIGTNFASNLMNYAFMHAGRWNELPRTERQQAPQVVPQAPRQGGQRLVEILDHNAQQPISRFRRTGPNIPGIPFAPPMTRAGFEDDEIPNLIGIDEPQPISRFRRTGPYIPDIPFAPPMTRADFEDDEIPDLIGANERMQALLKLRDRNLPLKSAFGQLKQFPGTQEFQLKKLFQTIPGMERNVSTMVNEYLQPRPSYIMDEADKRAHDLVFKNMLRRAENSPSLLDDERFRKDLQEMSIVTEENKAFTMDKEEAQAHYENTVARQEYRSQIDTDGRRYIQMGRVRTYQDGSVKGMPYRQTKFHIQTPEQQRQILLDLVNKQKARRIAGQPVENKILPPDRPEQNEVLPPVEDLPVDEEKLQEHEERQRNAAMPNAPIKPNEPTVGQMIGKGRQLSFSESKQPESPAVESEKMGGRALGSDFSAVKDQRRAQSEINQESKLNDWYNNFGNQATLPSNIPPTPSGIGVTMTQAAGRTPAPKKDKAIEMQTPDQLKGYPTGDLMGTPLTQESSAQQYQRAFYEDQNEFKTNVQILGNDIKAHVNKVNQVVDTLNRSSAGTFGSTKSQGRLQDEFVMPPPSQSITTKQRGRYSAYPQSIRSLLSQEFPNYQFQVRLNDDHIRELRGVSGKRATLRKIVIQSGQFVQRPPPQLISNSASSEPAPVELQPIVRFNPPPRDPVDTRGSLNIGEEGQEGNESIESSEL